MHVTQDTGLIRIQWEGTPDAGPRIAESKFPHPLVTVDYALDGRPIAVQFVGSLAQALRSAISPIFEVE